MTPTLCTRTLLWLCLLACSTGARAAPYHLVTEEWAPYNYQQNNRITGLTTEIVQAIMAITGDHFEVTLLPSMRTRYELNNHPHTIMFSMFRTRERDPLYKWVGPIVEESIYPYQLADTATPIDSRQQLLEAPQITTRQAGLIPDRLADSGFANLDKSATSNLQLYRMLLAGRTGVIVGDTPAGVTYYSRQLNIAPGTLRQIPVELYRSSLYIAFSRDCDDKVVAAWADALEQLRASGELARIQQRYAQPLAQHAP